MEKPSQNPGTSGKTLRIIQNTYTKAEDYLSERYMFRYNVVSCGFESRRIEDILYTTLNEDSIYRELQKAGIDLSLSKLISLLKSDYVERYDPFLEYFSKLPQWDGVDHISKLASYIDTRDKTFSYHFKKHLVRVVACALDDSYFNKHALILVHPKQGSGKTTFMRFLCPEKLKDYIAEDISTDKDSRILLSKNLLINLDELALLSKKDINQLKAFISKTQINERLPYGRTNTILPRRASFVGSTNQTEFLNDETGNVRWLCFELVEINFDYKRAINIDDVYSQAYHLYKSGSFEYNLTKEDIQDNEERNRKHQILTLEKELIQRFFIPDHERKDANFKTASEITDFIYREEAVHKLNFIQIGKAMKSLGFPEGRDRFMRYGYYAQIIQPSKQPSNVTN